MLDWDMETCMGECLSEKSGVLQAERGGCFFRGIGAGM